MKKIFVLVGIVAIGVLIVAFFINGKSDATGNLGEANIKYPSDVVGTKVGTTTAGVYFAGPHSVASTSYIIRSGSADKAIFTARAVNASTTLGASVQFSVYGSNDWSCTTATTTRNVNDTTNEQVLMTEVFWYDIGSHISELAGSQTSSTGTSTLLWTPTDGGYGTDFTLTNLNYQCIKLEVSASSTELLIQVRNK